MIKPTDYDDTKLLSDYSPLPAGGYVCKIVKLEEVKSRNDREMIKVMLDIAEGDEKDRFRNQYTEDNRTEKKWKCNFFQSISYSDGNTSRGFKTFVEMCRKENDNFNVNWGSGFSECFKGKLIGMLFRREEYEYDGKRGWNTRPYRVKEIEDIRAGNFEIPEDKPLEDKTIKNLKAEIPEGFEEISDDDIPF